MFYSILFNFVKSKLGMVVITVMICAAIGAFKVHAVKSKLSEETELRITTQNDNIRLEKSVLELRTALKEQSDGIRKMGEKTKEGEGRAEEEVATFGSKTPVEFKSVEDLNKWLTDLY